MLFLPLPFVVALLLVILMVRMVMRLDQPTREDWLFLMLMGAYALQSVLIGTRWGYDIRAVLPLQTVLATLIAALAWLCFSSLAHEGPPPLKRLAWHLLPAALVAVLMLLGRDAVNLVIILVFLGYGAALFRLAALGPNGLVASRLDGALRSYRALLVTAFTLIASAVSDIVISFDYLWNGGAHAGAVVAVGNVLALLVLGTAAATASVDTVPMEDPDDERQRPADERPASDEDATIVADVDQLMLSKALYKDLELNLARLARKLRLPARRISNAINRVHGISVSQYVNNYRVAEACRLLADTDEPITRIAFDAGFMTKSNFNREFLRVTGMSPSTWRERNVQKPALAAVA